MCSAGVIVCLCADLPSRIFVGIKPCTRPRPRCKCVSGSGGECPDPADKLLDLHFSHLELNWILCSVTNHPFTFVRSMSFIFCLNYGSWIRRISHVNLVLLPTMNNCLPMSGRIWRWEAPEHEEIRNWDIMKSVVRNSYFTLFYSFFCSTSPTLSHWTWYV